jgi:hypothetical protein
MSLLKTNAVQIGQSATATNNFTLAVPSSPDQTIKLARGNAGNTTADIITVNSSGQITASITGSTISNSTINGGSITSAISQNATGTNIDFTGIPSWVKRITVIFNEVVATQPSLVQIGDSGGVETTGYISTSIVVDNVGLSTGGGNTTGFIWFGQTIGSGLIQLVNVSANTWISSHNGKISTTQIVTGGGSKTLSSTLDRIRITTVGGAFTSGSVNITYEG